MELFRPRLISSLPEALAASKCRRLLIWVDEEFQSSGKQLLQLTHLQELSLQGKGSIFDYPNFILPVEIGQLRTLCKLTLLNLPVILPEWITQLSELRELTVRGTNLIQIPDWISQMQRLETLQLGNCQLQNLPETLRHMNNLRHLTFADIQLREIRPEHFPQHLKSLVFSGSGKYSYRQLTQLRQSLKGTKIYSNPDKIDC
jgi:Leucine-rich repeat (LRR) protein